MFYDLLFIAVPIIYKSISDFADNSGMIIWSRRRVKRRVDMKSLKAECGKNRGMDSWICGLSRNGCICNGGFGYIDATNHNKNNKYPVFLIGRNYAEKHYNNKKNE